VAFDHGFDSLEHYTSGIGRPWAGVMGTPGEGIPSLGAALRLALSCEFARVCRDFLLYYEDDSPMEGDGGYYDWDTGI